MFKFWRSINQIILLITRIGKSLRPINFMVVWIGMIFRMSVIRPMSLPDCLTIGSYFCASAITASGNCLFNFPRFPPKPFIIFFCRPPFSALGASHSFGQRIRNGYISAFYTNHLLEYLQNSVTSVSCMRSCRMLQKVFLMMIGINPKLILIPSRSLDIFAVFFAPCLVVLLAERIRLTSLRPAASSAAHSAKNPRKSIRVFYLELV